MVEQNESGDAAYRRALALAQEFLPQVQHNGDVFLFLFWRGLVHCSIVQWLNSKCVREPDKQRRK